MLPFIQYDEECAEVETHRQKQVHSVPNPRHGNLSELTVIYRAEPETTAMLNELQGRLISNELTC